MARINHDDDLYKQQAWTDLVIDLKDREKALGAWLWATIVEQQFYAPDRKPIPIDTWKRERLNDALLRCGLAWETAEGICLWNAEKRNGWLIQAHEAGKRGGRPKKEKPDERVENPPVSDPNPSKPSSSSSCSSSTSNSIGSNSSRPSDDGRRADPIYKSADELKAGLGAKKLAEWFVLYPDAKWIDDELKVVFQYYADKPERLPGTAAAWIKAVAFHLTTAWEVRKNVQARDSILSNLGKVTNIKGAGERQGAIA